MNKQLVRLCKTSGMNIMLWTIDPKDWQNKNETKILANLDHQLGLNGNMRGGAVLLHDIYPATVRALNPFLDKLSANEYQIANATNFADCDDSQYWAAISPKLIRFGGFKRPVNPEILDHQLLSKLFAERNPPEMSSMAMLKANRSNDLLIYLAQHN